MDRNRPRAPWVPPRSPPRAGWSRGRLVPTPRSACRQAPHLRRSRSRFSQRDERRCVVVLNFVSEWAVQRVLPPAAAHLGPAKPLLRNPARPAIRPRRRRRRRRGQRPRPLRGGSDRFAASRSALAVRRAERRPDSGSDRLTIGNLARAIEARVARSCRGNPYVSGPTGQRTCHHRSPATSRDMDECESIIRREADFRLYIWLPGNLSHVRDLRYARNVDAPCRQQFRHHVRPISLPFSSSPASPSFWDWETERSGNLTSLDLPRLHARCSPAATSSRHT